MAVESVLDQDHPEVEVIVIDDGSSDETLMILDRIAETAPTDRFRWEHQERAGEAAAISRGLEASTGELIGILRADDYLLPSAISRLVAVSGAKPEADVIYPWFRLADRTDDVIDVCECIDGGFLDMLRLGYCIPGVGALFRRRCYERVGGWEAGLRYVADYEWWLRLGDVRYERVPEVLAVQRAREQILDRTRALDELHERLQVLDTVFIRRDVPAEVIEVMPEAYATALVSAAWMLDPDLGAPGRRFAVEEDRTLGPSAKARNTDDQSRLRMQAELRAATLAVERCQAVNQHLEAAVDALRRAIEHHKATVAMLMSTARSPRWVRVARTITPPSLRPRVGALYRRVRGPRAW
jgi:GT2 family glycosyltransferase